MIFALPDDHLQSAPRRQHGKTYAGQERKWRVSRRSASMEPSRGAGWLACLAHGSSSSWICCTHCLLAAGRPLFDRHLPSSVYPSYRHAPTVDGGMMQDESRIRASRSRQSRSRCGGHHAVLLRSARLHALLFFWVDNLPQRTTDQPPAALARLARVSRLKKIDPRRPLSNIQACVPPRLACSSLAPLSLPKLPLAFVDSSLLPANLVVSVSSANPMFVRSWWLHSSLLDLWRG
ncbi:uncharacterized protein IWZ02DRAFT_57225 [Phyllosticta citriasiana]|uniref:uncharacterized protein n=1 Tax=Phyllosticta citriasiana TaxID=595635 RepID=UPI0030FDA5FA